ncbi:MAG TPA: hypothetical protein VGI97_14695 [Gemmatimonadaceae bacterium]|jgi:hypothetical protein
MTAAEMALAPRRRIEDRGWASRVGQATRTVLPPLFALLGMAVFCYHAFGIHARVVHGSVQQATEEVSTIDLLVYLSSVATAFGAKHFDALAGAIANRISLTKTDVSKTVTAFAPNEWANGTADAGVM